MDALIHGWWKSGKAVFLLNQVRVEPKILEERPDGFVVTFNWGDE